jgi:type IV secretory pathway VirB3-like protein
MAAMHTTRRGEPLPINQALNRPRAKLGLELSTWMVIVFVTVAVFLVGFRLLAILSFPTLAGGAWLIVRKHPKMFQLWGLSLNQKSYYDPRKY